MKILVGVPCMEYLPVEFVNSLMNLKGVGLTDTHLEPLSLVYIAREKIADMAITGEYDYVLFIDSDMVFNRNLLVNLIKADKDIVTGLAMMRKPPYNPCIYKKVRVGAPGETQTDFYKDYSEGLIEIEGCGMACCLIKTEVFKAIKKKSLCFFPMATLGEDLAFCVRARQCGYKLYADTRIKVGHLGQTIVTEDTFKAWNEVSE